MISTDHIPATLAAMSQNDAKLLVKEASNAKRYVEYGSGDSTRLVVAQHSVDKIISVESDAEFTRRLSEELEIKAAIERGRLNFINIDIGPVGAWGMPINESRKSFWPNYYLAPFVNGIGADVVLVDGRFRVACSLAAICANPMAKVLVHDYSWRAEYHILGKLLELISTGDTLAVFRARKSLDQRKLFYYLRLYAYAPDDFPRTLSGITLKFREKLARRCGKRLFTPFGEV